MLQSKGERGKSRASLRRRPRPARPSAATAAPCRGAAGHPAARCARRARRGACVQQQPQQHLPKQRSSLRLRALGRAPAPPAHWNPHPPARPSPPPPSHCALRAPRRQRGRPSRSQQPFSPFHASKAPRTPAAAAAAAGRSSCPVRGRQGCATQPPALRGLHSSQSDERKRRGDFFDPWSNQCERRGVGGRGR